MHLSRFQYPHLSCKCRVFLNDVELRDCYEANEEEGYALCWGGVGRVTGNVEIRCPPDVRTLLEAHMPRPPRRARSKPPAFRLATKPPARGVDAVTAGDVTLPADFARWGHNGK